jgi:hypothetical protein
MAVVTLAVLFLPPSFPVHVPGMAVEEWLIEKRKTRYERRVQHSQYTYVRLKKHISFLIKSSI